MRTARLPRSNPDLLVRPRLLALLDESAPVSWLLAPAGAGKTVLALQWASSARDRGARVLWFDGDADPADEVVRALGVPEGSGSAVARLRRWRRELRHGAPSPLLEEPTAVVIDHAEPLVAALGDELVALVRDVPGLRLVVCLRRRLDPMARGVVAVQSRTIGLADLLLTAEEVQALARRAGVALAAEEAARIRASVGGWPVLVRMGLADAPAGAGDAVWSPRHLAWSLEGALESALPPDAVDALCRAALAEEPTAGALEAAIGPLDEVARRTFAELGLLDPVGGGGAPVLQLPPLLGDLFRRWYAARGLGSEAPVHERVVDHWRAAGDPRRALRQAVRGRCWPLAVGLVEEHWWAVLGEDLHALPVGEVRGHALVELARQASRPDDPSPTSPSVRAREVELRALPVAALRQVAVGDARAGETLGLLTLLLVRDRRRGDHEAALDLAARLEVVLTGGRVAAADAVDRAAAEAGRTRLLAGLPRAARRVLRTSPGPAAAVELALVAAVTGDRVGVRRWRERREAAGVAGWIALAWEAQQALDQHAAAESLGRVEAAVGPADELWPVAAWLAAQHALGWGGRRRVLADLRAAREAPARPPFSEWSWLLVVAAEADLGLSLGRIGEASRLLAAVDRSCPSVAALLSRARLDRMVGHPGDALALLQVVDDAAHTSDVVEVERLLLRGWALDGSDAAEPAGRPRDEVVVAVGAAFAIAVRVGVVLPLAGVPRELLDRCAPHVPGLAEALARLDAAGVRPAYALAEELPVLTPRERAVLAGLARDLSLADIAGDLFVSRNTVKTQAASLYRKLGVPGRAEAVRKARRTGLV